MTLRARLVVSAVAVVIPLSLALLALDEQLRLRDMHDALQRFAESEIVPAALDLCEARREGPFEIIPYAGDFTADIGAPEFPKNLRDVLATGDSAAGTFPTPEGPGAVFAIRARQSGPCSIVLARMRPRPGTRRDRSASLVLVVVSVLLASGLAAGPVIARLRRLAAAVRQSAAAHYEQAVVLGGSDEVSGVADAFNAAGADIRRHIADVHARRDALRNFVADTTHDIALPLTVLQGHLVELEQSFPQGSTGHEHVREAIQEAHYLSSLLRNLGTAARLEEGSAPADRHTVDLGAVVERVVSRHRALARAKHVELDFAVPEHPLRASADVTLFEQAVSNLVDNAVHYNRPGGHVAVVLDRLDASRFVLTVSDDGPGVAAEELSQLAMRQFRGSSARSRPEGQGLGLSIATAAISRLEFTLNFRRPEAGGLLAEISGPAAA